MSGYYPDDCGECPVCGRPVLGGSYICRNCEEGGREHYKLDKDWRNENGRYCRDLMVGWLTSWHRRRDEQGRFA